MGMQTYRFVLNSGEEITPSIQNATWISCNGAIGDFEIAPDSKETLTFFNGAGVFLTEPAKSVRIKNGGTAQTITLNCGDGQFIDNRIAGAFTISGGVQIAGNSSVTTAVYSVGVAGLNIATANGTRNSILIQNLSPSGNIYVGGAGVTAANGIKVAAGGSIVINTRAIVRAVADLAATEVRTMEEIT